MNDDALLLSGIGLAAIHLETEGDEEPVGTVANTGGVRVGDSAVLLSPSFMEQLPKTNFSAKLRTITAPSGEDRRS